MRRQNTTIAGSLLLICSIFTDCGTLSAQKASTLEIDREATRLNPVDDGPIYKQALHNLSFDPTGKFLAAGQGTGRVFIWDLEKKELVHDIVAHEKWTFTIQFMSDGSRLITGGGDNLIKIWDLSNPEEPKNVLAKHQGDVHAIVLNGDEKRLFSAGDDMVPLSWNLEAIIGGEDPDESVVSMFQHPRQIPAMAISPDNQFLVTSARDGKIRVFDLRDLTLMHELAVHARDCITVRYIPGTPNIVSGGYEGTVQIWNARMGYKINEFAKLHNSVVCVDTSHDGKQVVAIDEKTMAIFQVENPTIEPEVLVPELVSDEQLSFIRFHPDGKRLFATTTLGRVFEISREELKIVNMFQAPMDEANR
ncbi:MAG TPA: WD40 repeat domain-containing protein [Pirellulaceae bacterium]|nr:WD40 repeat domain-containing protein [Pirellulaceae bacterium]HMO93879.1 WD40 repeat domain-containing protein [Pirellulaceae bacterium]HMP70900.1 WD40 repeat domain-containing protein [Pirellulaceae bacterium]